MAGLERRRLGCVLILAVASAAAGGTLGGIGRSSAVRSPLRLHAAAWRPQVAPRARCAAAADGVAEGTAIATPPAPGGVIPSRASVRALEIEDKMLVLRIRRDLAQGEFAAELGREWLRDMSMVSDIAFGTIARKLRRDQATVRTRLAARGVLPSAELKDLISRQQRTADELVELARQYAAFASSQQADSVSQLLPETMDVRQQFARARRTIAKLSQRRQQLQTTIEAPAARSGAGGSEAEGGGGGGGGGEHGAGGLGAAVSSAQQLWARITPASLSSADSTRRMLDDEARALRISRTEMDKLSAAVQQLVANQQGRSAALSEDSRRFVLDEMVNAQASVAKMQTDLVVRRAAGARAGRATAPAALRVRHARRLPAPPPSHLIRAASPFAHRRIGGRR